MTEIYCKYCLHNWKHKKEYDKHLACCEFFYQLRRNPHTEMDDYGNKLPSHKELFRFVQELSLKCERLEREVVRLKSSTSIRQKKIIMDCLNHSTTIPAAKFPEWWKTISLDIPVEINTKEKEDMVGHWSDISNPYLFRVFHTGLVEGIKYVLGRFMQLEKQHKRVLPVRCFTQKPNMFYIYCRNEENTPSKKTKPTSEWKSLTNVDLEMMVDYISQLFVREFLAWLKRNTDLIGNDERRGEEQINYMMRVNSMRPTKEKGMVEIRKWLFSTLEENAQSMSEMEFI